MAKRKIEIQYDSDGGRIVMFTNGPRYELMAIMVRALQKKHKYSNRRNAE